jgi:hypothetical protein
MKSRKTSLLKLLLWIIGGGSIGFLIALFTSTTIKTSNVVGIWNNQSVKYIENKEVIDNSELTIERIKKGVYKYQLKRKSSNIKIQNPPKTNISSGSFEKYISNNKWIFNDGYLGENEFYIVIPEDNWNDYNPDSIVIQSNNNDQRFIFNRKRVNENIINLDNFIGNWSDGENLNLSIAMSSTNNDLSISYYSGPCSGYLIGQKSEENNSIELTHKSSECNYRGFDNSHILNKKIGQIDLIDGDIVLDIKIGDDLLIEGNMFLYKMD